VSAAPINTAMVKEHERHLLLLSGFIAFPLIKLDNFPAPRRTLRFAPGPLPLGRWRCAPKLNQYDCFKALEA
jgi:hypothetical protein